jgi:3-deoxy-D-manno-octulosonate 8-phosphate phosphatase (KDO 8-P phosphatase)
MDAKLLILDVDGVLTDGTKSYGPHGTVISKNYADVDFTGIKCFKQQGWHVCWLSADRTCNEAIAKDRGIDFFYSRDDDGTIDKVKWLTKLLEHYQVKVKDVVYVGDDLFDLPIMRRIKEGGGDAWCPTNAAPQVKREIRALAACGGHGAVMELYFKLYQSDATPPSH